MPNLFCMIIIWFCWVGGLESCLELGGTRRSVVSGGLAGLQIGDDVQIVAGVLAGAEPVDIKSRDFSSGKRFFDEILTF